MTVSQRTFRYPGGGGAAPALPFTSLPAAASANGQVYRIPELGNAELISNGSIWLPRSGRQMIKRISVPVGIAPTGSVAANGAITLGTALNTTFSGGLWLYLPAGAAYAGSTAGFYWAVMSSTTLGTLYNNTYNPVTDSGAPPASPTAISAAGPGAYSGTTAEITALSVNIPGGLLGVQGGISTFSRLSWNSSAGNKALFLKYGGVELASTTFANVLSSSRSLSFTNIGVADKQMGAAWGDYTNATVAGFASVNSTVDKALTISIATSTAATDVNILPSMYVELVG